eukprot:627423-Rhodomonas_salina.1
MCMEPAEHSAIRTISLCNRSNSGRTFSQDTEIRGTRGDARVRKGAGNQRDAAKIVLYLFNRCNDISIIVVKR